jgi:hypothetical protein
VAGIQVLVCAALIFLDVVCILWILVNFADAGHGYGTDEQYRTDPYYQVPMFIGVNALLAWTLFAIFRNKPRRPATRSGGTGDG